MKTMELSKIEISKTFKIGEVEFIKFKEVDGVTVAVAKDVVFHSVIGNNNNFAESTPLERLTKEFLTKIAEVVGEENICEFETDLTTLDGLKPYENLKSKVGLVTLDFYRENVKTFDMYMPDCYWWLATPESARPHDAPNWVLCVSPSGCVSFNICIYNYGVRPVLHFVSSISVSCDE